MESLRYRSAIATRTTELGVEAVEKGVDNFL